MDVSQTITGTLNETLVVDCCVQGKLTNFKWYKDSEALPSEIAGEGSEFLVFPSLQKDDIGLYTCIAGGGYQVFVHNIMIAGVEGILHGTGKD